MTTRSCEVRAFADRHHLEEARDDAALPRPAHQRLDLDVVLVLHDHGVELDLVEARRERSVDAAQHDVELSAAGHALEASGVEAVERHVHAAQARFAQRGGELLEARRVRRDRDVVEPERAEEPNHRDEVAMQERLAAGEPHPADTSSDEAADHRLPGLEIEPLVDVTVLLVRTAIDAREVATVGQREPDRTRRGRPSRDCGTLLKDREGVHRRGL